MIIYSCYAEEIQHKHNVKFEDGLESLLKDLEFTTNRVVFLPQTGGSIRNFVGKDSSLTLFAYSSTNVLDVAELEQGFFQKKTLKVLRHEPYVRDVLLFQLSSKDKEITDEIKTYCENSGFKSQQYDF